MKFKKLRFRIAAAIYPELKNFLPQPQTETLMRCREFREDDQSFPCQVDTEFPNRNYLASTASQSSSLDLREDCTLRVGGDVVAPQLAHLCRATRTIHADPREIYEYREALKSREQADLEGAQQ